MAGTPDPTQQPSYEEGQRAFGPNGEMAVYTNGKWEIRNRTAEDIKRIAVPSAVRGTAGLVSTPHSIHDIGTGVADWLLSKTLDKILPQEIVDRAKEARESGGGDYKPIIKSPLELWPSQEDVMGKVRDVTGREFNEQAETPIGSLAQTAIELAPSAAAGPGKLAQKGLSYLGSVGASEGAGQLAANYGPEYEEGKPNYEGWARLLGATAGQYIPAILRRGRTPFPVTDPRQAAKNKALDAAGIDQRFGQSVGPPGNFWDRLERDNIWHARGGLSPEGQQQQFGQFAHKQADIRGPEAAQGVTSPTEVAQSMNRTGGRIEAGYNASTPTPDAQFRAELNAIMGKAPTGTQKALSNRLAPFVMGATPKGVDVRKTMNELQRQADIAAGRNDTQTAAAFRGAGSALRGAVDRSLVGTPYADLPRLRQTYTNQVVLNNAYQGATPGAVFAPTPKAVYDKLGTVKNPKAQQTALGKIADIAGQRGVGGQYLKPSDVYQRFLHSAPWGAAGTILGGGGSYLTTNDSDKSGYPILGAIGGGIIGALARSNPIMGKLLLNRHTQKYLKNQKYMPSPLTTPNHRAAALIAAGFPRQPEPEQ